MKPSLRNLAGNWWYVLAWLGVIRMESTSAASADNTSKLLYIVLATVYPNVQPSFVEQLDEVLRKSGHFLGCGILSVLVFLALRNTNRDRLRALLRPWGAKVRDFWRREWVGIGMLMTIVTAAFDEMHQSFLPTRTGQWQDVVLDACGGAALQALLYFFSMCSFRRRSRAGAVGCQ
ncbi:MAG: VanZ family protein [Acidobacteriota bacterium]|nr:VanZ family protein [Acidobacteriota bacterium]